MISGFVLVISLLGLVSSWINPSIQAPLLPGLDFTGGTQIVLERNCSDQCSSISSSDVQEVLSNFSSEYNQKSVLPDLTNARIQFLDAKSSVVLKVQSLTATQSKEIINDLEPLVGPYITGGLSVDTIGPTLGIQLLRSSLISLLVAFVGIATYISIRFDKRYAFLALLALLHDVIIVCGIFSWLGVLFHVEVNSLFAVALLTISGYSVNDTVVVFDRIRELNLNNKSLSPREKIDQAVSATFTRTIYTSTTTLLPLIALIIFGGNTLYWFSIALAIGIVVGSWSSIALAPSILILFTPKKDVTNNFSVKNELDLNDNAESIK
tara:strand:+ start:3006 stop:3974 length:969 start_codon:yes stop_codon:yes gene_type:complete